jgi:hypothetical protein
MRDIAIDDMVVSYNGCLGFRRTSIAQGKELEMASPEWCDGRFAGYESGVNLQ